MPSEAPRIEADFLRRLAAAAAKETLPRFRAPGAIDNKLADGFDPVTQADRAAETAIRAEIAGRFPEHGILGEEFGAERADSRCVWVIDPIDGTRAFISGLPLWGTLVGFAVDGEAKAGLMSQPFTGELFYATHEGAFYERGDDRRALAVRGTARLADATLCTTSPFLFSGTRRAAYDRVEAQVRLPRYGTDCYAYAMLAAGHVDLVIESGLNPYDIMALIPIVEKAGGIITGWNGEPAEQGGDILAAATPELHAAAGALLSSR